MNWFLNPSSSFKWESELSERSEKMKDAINLLRKFNVPVFSGLKQV